MSSYYEFSGDIALSSAGKRLLEDPGNYYEQMFWVMHDATDIATVDIGAPTQERWRRMLAWCQHLDEALDNPVRYPHGQEVYDEAITALRPDSLQPPRLLPDDDASRRVYRWCAPVSSSLSEGDISNDRRERLYATATALGTIATGKKTANTIGDYIAVCRAEGPLIADLLMDCLSDTEIKTPAARGMREWLRPVFSAHILADSAFDFLDDAEAQRLHLSFSFSRQFRLLGAVGYALTGEYVRAPRQIQAIIHAQLLRDKQSEHKLIDNKAIKC